MTDEAEAFEGKTVDSSVKADAFVSYSHHDKEWVRNLADRLSKERVDGRPLKIVIDENAFVPGVSLTESIERGVRTANRLICVLSPDFVASDWTALEYQMKLLDDPAGRKGLIIPILYRNCDVPYVLRIRLCSDFRKEVTYEVAYQRLLAALVSQPSRGEPGGVSLQSFPLGSGYGFPASYEADVTNEEIALNMFQITSRPEYVWSARTSYLSALEIFEEFGTSVDFGFSLRGGELWSLYPLSKLKKGLDRLIVRETVKSHSIPDMMTSDKQRDLVIDVLNRTLGNHLRKLGVRFDNKYSRYYFPPDAGKARIVAWPALKRSSKRVVTLPCPSKGIPDHYEHLAAVMRFIELGGHFFLLVLPTRSVTVEGYTPMRGPKVGPLVVRRTYDVYNNQFWSEVMFWLYQLHSRGKLEIGSVDGSIEISGSPVMVRVDRGIRGDKTALFGSEYMERWREWAPSLEEEVEECDRLQPDRGNDSQ